MGMYDNLRKRLQAAKQADRVDELLARRAKRKACECDGCKCRDARRDMRGIERRG